MSNFQLTDLEKEMTSFDFNQLNSDVQAAKAKIAKTETAADIKAQICSIWSKIRKYVVTLEVIPVVGKFITIFADLLDTLCKG
jgi:hypothetical protein